MSNLLPTKKFLAFGSLFFLSCTAFAQAKLNINGAYFNIGTGMFVSTNDISVTGASLLVAGSTLKVANSITSTNAINVSLGTLEMNGTAAQQIPANSLTGNVIKNLIISGTDDVTVAGPLDLTDVLTVANSGSLSSGGYLTLKSTAGNTARIAPITTSATVPVNGNVIVERFITSKRAFRFLTAPVNTPGSIRANWMENTNNPNLSVNNNPVPGYGTHITGLLGGTNGFDATITNNPSLFAFNNQTQAWTAATTTTGTLNVGMPYRILVRGDRSTNTNLAAPPSSITTLRATGTVATRNIVMAYPGGGGTTGMPELSNAIGGYSFVGNPYASPIDWDLLDKTNLSGTLYIWDATLSGTNGRGAYVTYNSGTGVSNISSNVDNNLQSGQAFFVQTTGSNPSLTFKENYKSDVHRAVFRAAESTPHLSLQLLLPGQDTSFGAADGLAAFFADDYDSAVSYEDSYKFSNLDENIAIARHGILLSVEGRKPVSVTDTLPLKVWQFLQKSYTFKSVLNHLSNVDTYLDDSYLNTSTKLKNDDTTFIPFTLNADSGSFANNRFRIVFKNSSTLPVTLTGIKAYPKLTGIQVDWIAQSEQDMESYIIEKSADGSQFIQAGTVKANLAPGLSSQYGWFDENPGSGDNYYRIKSVSKSGEVKYSSIVKVRIDKKEEPVSVLAIAEGNTIKIQLKNVEKGKYAVTFMNSAGQKLYSGSLEHEGGSASNTIKINYLLPGGIYHLQMSIGNKVYTASVIIP